MPNDFAPFAGDPAANVLPLVDYLDPQTSPWRLAGFQVGTALSPNLNRVWRQASLIASMIAQFTENNSGQPSVDDGTTAGLLNNFGIAIANTVAGSVTGFLPLTGGRLTGDLEIDSNDLIIRAPTAGVQQFMSRMAGQQAAIYSQTAGNMRWATVLADQSPETGNNLGSNWALARYNDAGAYIDTPFSINRNTGVADFLYPPTIHGGLLPYVPIAGNAVMTGPLGIGGSGASYPGLGWWNNIAFGWAGAQVMVAVDGTFVGNIATTAFVNTVAGAYLPLAGGQVTGWVGLGGGLDCQSSATFRSSVSFANLGDFVNFTGSGWRYRQWAGNWYDAWNGADGMRLWQTYGGAQMTLDGGANLVVGGTFTAAGGRIMSHSDANSSVGVWSHPYGAGGMWHGTEGLWWGRMDGGANPTSGQMMLDYGGVLTVWNGIRCYNWLDVSAWFACDSIQARNMAYINNHVVITNVSGGVPALGLRWLGGNYAPMGVFMGPWGWGLEFGQVDDWGNVQYVSGYVTNAGWFAAAAGFSVYSDRAGKTALRASPEFDSLSAVRRIRAQSYDIQVQGTGGTPPPAEHVDFGFVAQDVQAVLPDATGDGFNGLAIKIVPLIVHAYRAIAQLAERLERMEASR